MRRVLLRDICRSSTQWSNQSVRSHDRLANARTSPGQLAYLESTWEGKPPPNIDPKFCKLYVYRPQGDAKYYRGQCSSLEEPDTHFNCSEERLHSHPEWFDPDEDLACYTRYEDLFSCSVQRPDGINHHGSTIRGQEGRTPPRTNRRGVESRTPPKTNHGSTNHGCPTHPERKLPLERTNPIPTSKKTMTMTPRKIYLIPTSMTLRKIRTPHRVCRLQRSVAILFVDQSRCGSHIICSNKNIKSRLSTNSDTWPSSE